jgi:DNA mismatch endonuclease (patch repair protein)
MKPKPPANDVRARIMKAVRREGTDIELAVRRTVARMGYRARPNTRSLPGRPDLSNKKRKWAIFVHGCFWHGHRHCTKTKGGAAGRVPVKNHVFWKEKLQSNRRRDARNVRLLRKLGFHVLTLWECDVRNAERLMSKLASFFRSANFAGKP